jgi:hypothetical protein
MNHRRRNARCGTATAELAVLLPLLVSIFLVATDFARVYYVSMNIENAINNAALFGSQAFDNQNQQWIGTNQYWQCPGGQVSAQTAVAVQLDGTNINPALADSNISVTTGKDTDGNNVNIVTATYQFNTIVPYPGIPSPVTIKRTAQVRVAPAVPN